MSPDIQAQVKKLMKQHGSSLSNNDLAFYLNTMNLSIPDYQDAVDYYKSVTPSQRLPSNHILLLNNDELYMAELS